jgi:hypothetical protein
LKIIDDCSVVLNGCQAELALSDIHDHKQYIDHQVLALTDYAHYVTYKIEFLATSNGSLNPSTDTTEFVSQVAETFSDARGWSSANYTFSRVQQAADADFTLVLAEAEYLNTVPGCDSNWSCRSGSLVIINEDRWNSASSAWNDAGGSLRDYRHMVVNHEVGHWLGLAHSSCSVPGALAPIMQQQSIDLRGCNFNPWPLQAEIDAV